MNHYRRKSTSVIAVQFEGSYESIRAICDWANTEENMALWQGEPLIDFITSQGSVKDVMFHAVDHDEHPYVIEPGTWVVKDFDDWFTMSDEEFKNLFEEQVFWRIMCTWNDGDSSGSMEFGPYVNTDNAKSDLRNIRERQEAAGYKNTYRIEPIL